MVDGTRLCGDGVDGGYDSDVKSYLGHRFRTGAATAPRHPPLKTAVDMITIVTAIIIIIYHYYYF